ncbi:hypothetical protein CAPTEDRAFT_223563 [Capitella teleta]|uniref:RUN domain-containing protein n=1 Tax=Capitella teleta TaxID=283909 RepID=R7TPS3_CAPTE|nr:hypothetical protein CAPTEDRAFT_223563 [Capitella teleta]|eukprot:ELT95863.1 hypothetical protein CAPTEDRAFT_223563 [Capitella teleta]
MACISVVAYTIRNEAGGPSPQELAKEGRIKLNLTTVLKSAVQDLQKVFIGCDTPIPSTDSANAVCNILEAVFLHGLKSWPSSKLKHLSQISAEVGLCRAWIRLALNEGLMESYLEALSADRKTLNRYYQAFAYLRDDEQCDIFKSYIQSLSYFAFELSYNSSVLNLWTTTPLILAGYVKGQEFPQPVVPSKLPGMLKSVSHLRMHSFAFLEVASVTAEVPEASSGHRQIVTNSALTPETPLNTPLGNTGLSQKDIDEIRKLTVRHSATTSTDTSAVSIPDFTDARDNSVMPSILQDLEELKFRAILADTGPIHAEGATAKLERKPSITDFLPKKSPPLQPELTNAVATISDVEIASDALSAGSPPSSVPVLAPVCSIDEEEHETDEPSGNSLGALRGWSSDFEPDVLPDVRLRQDARESSPIPIDESFNSLLHNYNQTSRSLEQPTLSDVLQSLPENSAKPAEATDEPERPRKLLMSPENSFDSEPFEFEVLPDLVPGDKSYLSDPKYQPLLEIIGDLCPERGLDAQNYQCKTCSRPVGMFYGKARVCTYNGGYYCYECHENETYYIPSRIIYNWDFTKHQVSAQSLDLPLINTSHPQHLRMQLYFLKIYLFTCRPTVADDLRRQVWPKEYFYDDIHTYSLNDLLQVSSGYLGDSIQKVIKFCTKHVYGCNLCSVKGFICEICNKGRVIYPFQMDSTTRCVECKSVYHKECKTELIACPKCARRLVRRQSATSSRATSSPSVQISS